MRCSWPVQKVLLDFNWAHKILFGDSISLFDRFCYAAFMYKKTIVQLRQDMQIIFASNRIYLFLIHPKPVSLVLATLYKLPI